MSVRCLCYTTHVSRIPVYIVWMLSRLYSSVSLFSIFNSVYLSRITVASASHSNRFSVVYIYDRVLTVTIHYYYHCYYTNVFRLALIFYLLTPALAHSLTPNGCECCFALSPTSASYCCYCCCCCTLPKYHHTLVGCCLCPIKFPLCECVCVL